MNLLVGEIVRTLSDLCLAFKVMKMRAHPGKDFCSSSSPSSFACQGVPGGSRCRLQGISSTFHLVSLLASLFSTFSLS